MLLQSSQSDHGIAMERFYTLSGISRQGYQQAKLRMHKEQEKWLSIEHLVNTYRQQKDRRAGSRSLYYNLSIGLRFNIGITKFERLMSHRGLSLAPQRVRVVTTRSDKQSWNYPNLANGVLINNINTLVVGDLTYIHVAGYLYYLFCLTDVYSARIVGYHLNTRMRAREAKKAFDSWVELRGRQPLRGCIHHTDGGSQYFSNLYISAMKDADLQISVARSCLDNGFAEQRNGLIKHHLLPTIAQSKGRRLQRSVQQSIDFYNFERKQEALGWLSPVEFEHHWSGKNSGPSMKLYNRKIGIKTQRNA